MIIIIIVVIIAPFDRNPEATERPLEN